jgi:hypothetical protein
MKNPDDTIRIQTYNLPACTTVPQLNTSPRFAGNPDAIKY